MSLAALLIPYILAMAFLTVVIADIVFIYTYKPARYVSSKMELEKAVEEYKRLRDQGAADKRAQRRLRKLLGNVHEKRRIVVRASLYRLLLILPLYFASAISVANIGRLIPSPCCIPLVTISVNGACLVPPSMLLLLAYIALIPLIQESLLSLLLAKRYYEKRIRETIAAH